MNPFDSTTNGARPYLLSEAGISWPSDARKYGVQTYPDLSQIRPPPNWIKQYPNGYSAASPPIDVSKDEHFQVWMRTAGLPNFRKLYSKNTDDDLQRGTYTMDINMSTYLIKGVALYTFFLFVICLSAINCKSEREITLID